ncbi:formylglycine-generating enzyme family protein [Gibbsiella dentisursi]|uniref:Formylglycine-generating enzyme family protein n=1 Tax=Gibbsiella dentisursi TaxID=796890 RepID=A0ABP7KUM6_9GAMM
MKIYKPAGAIPPASLAKACHAAPEHTAIGRREGMVWIPSGEFLMGSEQFYPEERPVRRVQVAGFWIDPCPVTNAQFALFTNETGYITDMEQAPDAALYPQASPALLVPGSLVFTPPAGPVSLQDYRAWWAYVPGANWRHPQGPESSIQGREQHPVVQLTYGDASAYAAWAGKALPTEEEWEYAARGGLDGAAYAWGDEFTPGGAMMANTWQGQFPWENLAQDGFEGTSPVKSFPANGYGLYDVTGNVWEWTRSLFAPRSAAVRKKRCCLPSNGLAADSRRVVKGGSHLCAPNYCLRYRPAARQGQTLDTATSHIGFRCVAYARHTSER